MRTKRLQHLNTQQSQRYILGYYFATRHTLTFPCCNTAGYLTAGHSLLHLTILRDRVGAEFAASCATQITKCPSDFSNTA